MAAPGQITHGTAWLLRAKTPLVYQKIEAGCRTAVGQNVWRAWWLDTWIYIPLLAQYQAQLLRSTWLCNPWHQFSHFALLSPKIEAGTENTGLGGILRGGPAVWNNWWWGVKYVAPFKTTLAANTGIYPYSSGTTSLGALRRINLVTSGTTYAYTGADSQADFAIGGDTLPYAYLGPPVTIFGRQFHVSPVFGLYSYQGQQAALRLLRGNLQGVLVTTSTRTILGPKRVSEVVSPPFDFSNSTLAGDSLAAPTITITVWSGVDPNPQLVWQGTALIVGVVVYPTLKDGVAGVIYQVEVTVTATLSGILSRLAYLTVLPDSL